MRTNQILLTQHILLNQLILLRQQIFAYSAIFCWVFLGRTLTLTLTLMWAWPERWASLRLGRRLEVTWRLSTNRDLYSRTLIFTLLTTKCQYMRVGLRRTDDSIYSLNNSCSDLDVKFDSVLSFADHISGIVFKAKQRASQILRCFLSNKNGCQLNHLLCLCRLYLNTARPSGSRVPLQQ